ncbi:9246_t:CDS:2, partial [Dentiscutata erythropus]
MKFLSIKLVKLAGSSDLNSCASFIKLAPLQNTTNPQSVLDAYCAAPKCSDNTTSADTNELKTQCATDLSAKDPNAITVKQFLIFNSPLRDTFPPESTSELTINLTSLQTLATSKCNASFLDGTVPTPTSSSSPTGSAKSGGISMHATSFIGFT